MPWREGLSDEQICAAGHVGSHARLLAGPGTGKTRTLTRRALSLVLEQGVDPRQILALTFTRVAAYDLRRKVKDGLEPLGKDTPRVSTLHSFALRQLLRNAHRIDALPQPLRIADDWEERHIIWEDIRDRLSSAEGGRETRRTIGEIKALFQRLSADWETLRAELADWEAEFPDPAFIGAWQEHRRMFRYTLRAELVYQLKRALNQYSDFDLEDDFEHVLVDEYQDLNPCDLAVIRELANRGCEVFAAGDDDQSIYGFRYADPEGIRRFTDEYRPCCDLTLGTCFRCDRAILTLAEFVASLDVDRWPKQTTPCEGAGQGEVHILRFRDQTEEAGAIAQMCRHLICTAGVDAGGVLVLLRSDTYRAFSSVIRTALSEHGIPVAEHVEESLLDTRHGRMALALLRLLADPRDHLAWRTALQLTRGIGPASLTAAADWARGSHVGFADALQAIKSNPRLAGRVGERLAGAVMALETLLQGWSGDESELGEQLNTVVAHSVGDEAQRHRLVTFLETVAEESEASSVGELVSALGASLGGAEQELVSGMVNILTMHKAKGLNADAVFVAAAEDRFLPGRNEGDREGDERRLLFVSMSRARHWLFITYCRRRTGQQGRLGRPMARPPWALTRFLRDAPVSVEDGNGFVSALIGHAD